MALPPELLILPALALAAGLDLYLTLLLLGLSPFTGWWPPPPGAVADLSSTGVLALVGGFYLLEATAERWTSTALLWNAFHAVIRPLAGGLLALLVLDGWPLEAVVVGVVLAGALASLTHAARTGQGVLFWLGAPASSALWLMALLEDVLVLGLIVLALDAPLWALAATAAAILVLIPSLGARRRAFLFALALLGARIRGSLGSPRWAEPATFPRWVRRAVEGDVMAPGGGLRGCFAGARRLPGAPAFVTGWVVVRGDTPIFVYRRLGRARWVDLAAQDAREVVERALFHHLRLGTGSGGLYFGFDGPSAEALRAEFLPRRSPSGTHSEDAV